MAENIPPEHAADLKAMVVAEMKRLRAVQADILDVQAEPSVIALPSRKRGASCVVASIAGGKENEDPQAGPKKRRKRVTAKLTAEASQQHQQLPMPSMELRVDSSSTTPDVPAPSMRDVPLAATKIKELLSCLKTNQSTALETALGCLTAFEKYFSKAWNLDMKEGMALWEKTYISIGLIKSRKHAEQVMQALVIMKKVEKFLRECK